MTRTIRRTVLGRSDRVPHRLHARAWTVFPRGTLEDCKESQAGDKNDYGFKHRVKTTVVGKCRMFGTSVSTRFELRNAGTETEAGSRSLPIQEINGCFKNKKPKEAP